MQSSSAVPFRQPRAVPEPTPECGECGDRRFLVDTSTWSARPCPECNSVQGERYLRSALGRAGLEADEIESALTPWDSAWHPEPEMLTTWGRKIALGEDAPRCLVVLGEPGGGKTKAMAMTVAAYLRAGGKDPLYATTAGALSRAMRDRVLDYGEMGFEGRIASAGILCFDEAGAEPEGKRSELFEEWIREALRRRQPLMINSNASTLSALGDGRIVSRLFQFKVTLSAPDYRRRCTRCGQLRDNNHVCGR